MQPRTLARTVAAIALASAAFGAAAQQPANPMDVVPDKMPNDIPYGAPSASGKP